MNPIVTILVPVHNHEQYIGRCLRSLLNQNFPRNYFEIMVINDCSTDNTKAAINLFKNKISYTENKKNLGLPATLNKGIKNNSTTNWPL